MATIDIPAFRNELLARGVDWSEQQIKDYIALKKSSNNLKVEMLKYDAPALYDIHRKWEGGNRSTVHNNPGAHAWSKELANKFGAKKGEPWEDSLGNTIYTAKYDKPSQGERASKFIINKIASETKTPEEYVARYADKELMRKKYGSDEAYNSYVRDVEKAFGPTRPTQNITRTDIDPYTGRSLAGYAGARRGQKNAMLDFAGNFLWEALDTTTFGALGALDREDVVETAITGGGPETFAGRVGAGLGGFAGFLVPFGATKAVVGAAVKAGKYGASTAAKNTITKGSEFLSKTAGTAGTGYSKFRKLGPKSKDTFFEPLYKESFNIGIKKGEATKAFAKRYDKAIDSAITSRLKDIGITVGRDKSTVKKLRQIIDEATHMGKGSHIPITTLQQRIALMLGGSMGAGKIANVASHALEEGIIFAAVETPMEVFQSIDEERAMDLGGRAAHAFALGNALGLIRFIPGGKDWGSERGIARSGWKRIKDSFNKKRPYAEYDVGVQESRNQLLKMTRGIWRSLGNENASKIFKDKLGKKVLKNGDEIALFDIDDLKRLVHNEEDAVILKDLLKGFDYEWQTKWWPEFLKEAGGDLAGSLPRMFAGTMAFNYELVFDDHIPLEDKIFHTALGAFLTKSGRKLTYTDPANGALIRIESTGATSSISKNLLEASENLRLLGMKPNHAILTSIANDLKMRMEWTGDIRKNVDIKSLNEILEKNGVIDDNNESKRRAPKDAGEVGMHPIYERAQQIYNFFGNQSYRMVDVDRVSVKTIEKIEKTLKNTIFEALTEKGGKGGISTLTDFDDILFKASDVSFQELVKIHTEAAKAIFDHLGKGQKTPRIVLEEKTNHGKPIYRFNHISIHGVDKNKLTKPNSDLLIKYNRIVDNLSRNGVIVLDRNSARTMNVKDVDFAGLAEIVDGYESKLSDLLQDKTPGGPMVERPELMQEGWLYELITHQSYFRGLRKVHEKIRDLENEDGLWNVFIDKETREKTSEGLEVRDLMAKLFRDPASSGSGYLYKTINFGSGVADYNRDFANTLLIALRNMPDANIPMQQGLEKSIDINNNGDISRLRKLFARNGINFFDNKDATHRAKFVADLNWYAMDRYLSGRLKKDGGVLNTQDKALMQQFKELRLMSPSFQMVDIIGVVREASKALNMAKIKINKKGQITGWKMSEEQFIENSSQSLLKLIEPAALEAEMSIQNYVKRLLEIYTEIVEPYEIDPATGNGFVRFAGDIAMPTPLDLNLWVNKLGHAALSKKQIAHTDFLEEMMQYKDHTEIPELARQQLNYLFAHYGKGDKSTTEVISVMAENKLFSFKDNKMQNISVTNPSLTKQLQIVVESVDRSLAGNLEAATIEGDINAYRTGMSKRSEIELYDNTSKQSVITKYNLSEDYQGIDFDIKNRDKILGEMKLKKGDDFIGYAKMNAREQFQALMDLNKVLLNTGQTVNLRRLYAVEGYGIFTDTNYKAYNNSFFNWLNKAGGVDKDGNSLGLRFNIVDMNLATRKSSISDARTDKTSLDIIMNLLNHNQHETYIDKDLATDAWGLLDYNAETNGSILIRLGDLSFGISIHKNDLPKFAKQFASKLKGWKGKYKDDASKNVLRKLTGVFDDLFDGTPEKVIDPVSKKETEVISYTLKARSVTDLGQSLSGQSKLLQTLVTADFMDNNLGKYWWNHWAQTFGGQKSLDVAKLFRRVRLMANLSMKELSQQHISDTFDLYTKHLKGTEHLDTRKAIKNFQDNNGFDIMIAQDEKGQSSIIKKLQDQINKESDNSKDFANDMLKDNFATDTEGNPEWAGGKDISEVDSYMVVDKQTMDALYAFMGAGHVDGLGGIKPIIHRLGDNAILGKTAFIRDTKMDAFLKKNKVNAILFESGAKVNYNPTASNVFKDWSKVEDFHKDEKGEVLTIDNMNNYREHLNPEDISLGAVMNSDHPATIPYQAFSHTDVAESGSVYDWLVRDNMDRFIEESTNLFKSPDFTKSMALAQHLNNSQAVRNGGSLYSRFIDANGLPTGPLFAGEFINQIKAEYMDKGGIMKLRTNNGGQSVASAGVDLRYTTFHKKNGPAEVYTYGQIALPSVAANKTVNVDRLHFIEHSEKGVDSIIKLSDIPRFKQRFQVVNTTELTNASRLGQVFKALQNHNKANKTKLEIAVVARRNPNTRPGDMPIVGLKEFIGRDNGNTVKLNAYDFAMRSEGDYDIDKLDFWWDTPNDVLKTWSGLSGAVIRVLPEKLDRRHSLNNKGEGIAWENPSSLNNHADNIAKSEKMRGVVVKMQRLLNALKQYDSGDEVQTVEGKVINGLVVYRGIDKGKDRGYIYADPAKIDIAFEKLAEDIQRITDSLIGHNDKLYDIQNWTKKFLFGDGDRYEGIFSRADYNKEKKAWIPNGIDFKADKLEKDIVLQIVEPYRRMLQLGTSLFSRGKAENIRYEDIISHMREFDAKMKWAPQNAYKNLLKKGYTRTQLDPIFKIPKTEKFNLIYGKFNENIRPNFVNPADTNFDNMLVFEKVMAKIAYNNHMKMDKPENMQGNALHEYQKFYEDNMFTEDFNTAASDAISQLQKENKLFGYMNFLDYRIRNQNRAKRNALGNGYKGLSDHIGESITELEGQKGEIENQLILNFNDDKHANKEFYTNLRSASKFALRNQIIQDSKTPNNWKKITGENWRKFSTFNKAIEYLNSDIGKAALEKYVKGDGIVRFVGMNSAEQLELLTFQNILGKYKDIMIDGSALAFKDVNNQMRKSVQGIRKFYNEKWRKHFDGSDWVMDKNRVNNLIHDKILKEYQKWEYDADGVGLPQGMGRLFLFKLMIPETDSFKFTYFNKRISPAFKTGSLSMIKSGLKFIAKSENIFSEFEKKMMFSLLAKARNNSFRAHYGQRGERGIWEYDYLSTVENYRHDINAGFPLIDDIRGWNKGIQEMEVNPQVAMLFGFNNHSLSYNLAHQPLLPEMAKELGNAAYLAYMPLSYIPAHATANRLPTVQGWNSWNHAAAGDAMTMLGHSANLRLLYNDVPRVTRGTYEGIQPEGGEVTGRTQTNNRIEEWRCG